MRHCAEGSRVQQGDGGRAGSCQGPSGPGRPPGHQGICPQAPQPRFLPAWLLPVHSAPHGAQVPAEQATGPVDSRTQSAKPGRRASRSRRGWRLGLGTLRGGGEWTCPGTMHPTRRPGHLGATLGPPHCTDACTQTCMHTHAHHAHTPHCIKCNHITHLRLCCAEFRRFCCNYMPEARLTPGSLVRCLLLSWVTRWPAGSPLILFLRNKYSGWEVRGKVVCIFNLNISRRLL